MKDGGLNKTKSTHYAFSNIKSVLPTKIPEPNSNSSSNIAGVNMKLRNKNSKFQVTDSKSTRVSKSKIAAAHQ